MPQPMIKAALLGVAVSVFTLSTACSSIDGITSVTAAGADADGPSWR